eukprot:scaffold49164_cov19-Tisochrysis_lutea.AAC.1
MGPPAPPSGPEPAYMKTLAPKSGLCPPDFHYAREVWWVALPSHITQCTVSMLENQKQSVHPCRVMCVFRGCGLILYSAFQWSKTHEVHSHCTRSYAGPSTWERQMAHVRSNSKV